MSGTRVGGMLGGMYVIIYFMYIEGKCFILAVSELQ